jgi:hypothetical protein
VAANCERTEWELPSPERSQPKVLSPIGISASPSVHCTLLALSSSGRYDLLVDRAVLDLKLQRDKLHQYSRRIQTVLNREKELAKEALTRGEKQKALLILRRRKYQEHVLLKADQQLETLEQLVSHP